MENVEALNKIIEAQGRINRALMERIIELEKKVRNG